MQTTSDQMAALNRLSKKVMGSLTVNELIQSAIHEIEQILKPDCVLFFIRDREKLLLKGMNTQSEIVEKDSYPMHAVGECLCGIAADSERPVFSEDIHSDPRCTWNECKKAGFRSFAALPIKLNGAVIGVLGLASYRERDFDAQADFLEALANEVIIGMKNALLLEEMRARNQELEAKNTALKQTEEALLASNRRYRVLFDEAPVMYVQIQEREGISYIADCNERFVKTLGYSRDELIDRPLADFYAADSRRRIKDGGYLITPDGRFPAEECQLVTKTGRIVETILQAKPQYQATGDPRSTLAMYVDTTAHRKAERDLEHSRHLFDAFMNHLPALAFMKDAEQRYIYFNNACKKYYHQEPCDRIGKTDHELWPKDVAEKIISNDRKVLTSGEALETVESIMVDGEARQHLISRFPIRQDGAPGIVGGIAFDISARIKAEEEKKMLERHLFQAQKMEAIGTLAGGIAHDFNNILSAILGYTELSLDKLKPGTALYENLQHVLNAGKRAVDLVKQILAFSHQGEQDFQPVRVGSVIKEALKLMRASLPATIEIRSDIESEVEIMADPTQIHRVIMNLSTNAAHAMEPQGGILDVKLASVNLDEEFVSRHPDIKPGPYVKLTVSDTGRGMAPQVMDRIFEPFFTTKAKEEGTGMGLSVVHGIIESHGGKITVYSTPGKGSVFSVFLPAVERRTRPDMRPVVPIPRGSERILFVDDEKAIVDLTEKMLGNLGYTVHATTSSLEALELFSAQPDRFDLVITDMTMPKMTGEALARHLMRKRPGIPVILCTGFSTVMDKNKAMAMGIRAFVNKPILQREIAETIRHVLDHV